MKKYAVGVSIVIFILVVAFILSEFVISNPRTNEENNVIFPAIPTESPRIDGNLDDAIWLCSPLDIEFVTYRPRYGELFPKKTLVWIAYDSKNLYFAFHCFDNEPEKIKTSITKRDNISSDDWVGLSLDSFGTGQQCYEFFVNPSGIQGDGINSAAGGEDSSPDLIWECAAKLTLDGYQVEISLPIKSIRFKSGREVKMGILFWRGISRLRISGTWPPLEPGRGMFNQMGTVIFTDVKKPLNLEFLPDVTLGTEHERNPKIKGNSSESFVDMGMGIKYGITSSITVETTFNPDFSQVESDTFQVEVNRRYPIFYKEKRPFFMEGADIMSFSTVDFGFFRTAVHTRRIINPLWGTKLIGTFGRASMGTLVVCDELPEPYEAYFAIARGKYGIGGDNYFGGIYSGFRKSGEYNHVFGADAQIRFLKNHQILSSFLMNFSQRKESLLYASNLEMNLMYSYITKPLEMAVGFEHIGMNFQMESSFLMRTGIDHGYVWLSPRFYPHSKKTTSLLVVSPEIVFQYVHDHRTHMDDMLLKFAAHLSFIKQGTLSIAYAFQNECWAQKMFNKKYLNLKGKIQPANWIYLSIDFLKGDQISYFSDFPFLGEENYYSIFLVFQPSKNFNLSMNFDYSDLWKNRVEKTYEEKVIFSRTTYQFNKYFFTRAIFQYNTYQRKLLLDLLASFTFIPGTVLHFGYGGLYDKPELANGCGLHGFGNLVNSKRSLFFKASYLWRF